MTHSISIYQTDGKTLIAQTAGNLKKFPRFHQPLCDEIVKKLLSKISAAKYTGKVTVQLNGVPQCWTAPIQAAFEQYNNSIK